MMRKALGFTLVEVMVVMVIITALAGLVGPFTIDAINKNERRAELSSLNNLLKKSGYRAYLTQSLHLVTFENNKLTIIDERNSRPWREVVFKYLTFPTQTLHINKNGFISPSELSVEYNNGKHKVQLDEKVNGIIEVKL
ncbi:hypothetical protein CBQ28_03660 [Pseudoalteromonas sp. GCY]|uniref:prepilin-type N-terminal cleavage/methylation domain-containing protein n=1 Tax=Pseudoalteromonas sp. GCY TaxID=2003316 RepID=UPI000BFEADC4|nr:prepilin-type N-terminal cleavage/methylation domain-containing protein [Pseudoalteromonas sp. GCY]PHI38625.1 hypothetical protein CBQ28_03660 [Pseudoalteromonas sp. GCY]QQQ67718.1 prepilin-type N-terminal cleavage/methylation domain-containing protein [Pseudoalteromonas sp. GCY]